jgi:excisionase family DNA binding protein
MTATQVAKWLNVSIGWVFDHASGRRRPILPSVKLGKSTRFDEDEVNAWLRDLRQHHAA